FLYSGYRSVYFSPTRPSDKRCNDFLYSTIRLPPISTLFPYTTLFRSQRDARLLCRVHRRLRIGLRQRKRLLAEDVLLRPGRRHRSEEHTSELQSRRDLVCRLLLEKKKKKKK